MKTCSYGFRIVGMTREARRLVDATAAFAGYAALDPRCEPNKEAYLSAFQFAEEFHQLLTETGSTAGYAGPCWSPWLWWDIDAEELHCAHKDAGTLAMFLVERYDMEPNDLLIFFSGAKGFHLGLPTCLWAPQPSTNFHWTARRFAENVAKLAAVAIDTGVYDRVRAFRAPNSRHPKTDLHKRRFSYDDLLGLPLEKIVELSREPAAFNLPMPTATNDQAAADWLAATEQVASEIEAKTARRAAGNGMPTLNKATLQFIREGAGIGDRHRLLFSAAANLAEFGCPSALAFALLEESALDSGLAPRDVRRQIECGLGAAASPSPGPSAPPSTESGKPPTPAAMAAEETPPAANPQSALIRLWDTPPTPISGQGEAVGDLQRPHPNFHDERSML